MSAEDKSLRLDVLGGAMDDDVFNVSFGEDDDTTPPAPQTPPTPQNAGTQPVDDNDPLNPTGPIDDAGDDTDADDSTPAPNTPPTAKLLSVLGANLADKGIINFDETEFSKAEDPDAFFENKITETINKRVEDAIKAKESEWPEEVSKLVDLAKKGVPLHAVLEADARIDSLEGIPNEEIQSNADLQKDILLELYLSQGFSKERAEAKVKRAEDLGSLKDDALDGFDVLLAREKAAKAEMIKTKQAEAAKATEAHQKRLEGIVTDIQNAKEIIPGIPLTDADKALLINGITKATATDKNGKSISALQKARMDDPMMDYKVAYFTLVLKGDLSKLQNKATAKATRSLKAIIDSNEPLQGGSLGGQTGPSKSNIDKSVLKGALSAFRRQTNA